MSDKIILLLSAGAVFTAVWLVLLRKRLDMPWYAAIPLAILSTVYGVLTAKVFAFLESGFNTDSFGNMRLFGVVFFMPLAYWLGAKLSKRSYREVFDVFTPCIIFTVMCARINCIVSGCCIGLPIPGMNGVRFPTREAEILFYIILLICLCPRVLKGKYRGQAYPIYMISYGAFRFVVEFFRSADTSSVFHSAHIWALIALIIGISIYAEIKSETATRKRRR
ncbi:MAG: prolipoprotein diacylglyceryl transferase [Eubacteriales bacterium]|nr:prolipoprotein diacylglyceryl transferase [Clostridiales bacterium]MDY5861147.1 prolipoprotein diacylglyceryl transferase [Eubacteriales bacterium]